MSIGGLLVAGLVLLGTGCARVPDAIHADERGRLRFAEQCALCHGSDGVGDGPAAFLLFPPARDFTAGRFKLAGTRNGVPTEADLMRTLRRGLPGSAMPAFAWMDGTDLAALARHVRWLAVDGLARRLEASGASPGDARAQAVERMTPGSALSLPARIEPDLVTLAAGRERFLELCAGCHGADGRGRPDVPRPDLDQTRNVARDLTTGVLKGGGRHDDLARSVLGSLHGTAMPPFDLEESALAELLAFLESLLPPDADARLVQVRQTLRAARVEALPDELDDPAWDATEPIAFALAPLWWRAGALVRAEARALEDGTTLALRLDWPDPSPEVLLREEPPFEAPRYVDAGAVQFSPRATPAAFGMGAGDPPPTMWSWRAQLPFSRGQLALLEDVGRVHEWRESRASSAAVVKPAQGPVRIAGESRATVPAGMELLAAQEPSPDDVRSMAAWSDGHWTLLLSGPRPDGPARAVSFALWNGAIGDLRGQKSVTIWHGLALGP